MATKRKEWTLHSPLKTGVNITFLSNLQKTVTYSAKIIFYELIINFEIQITHYNGFMMVQRNGWKGVAVHILF